MNETAFPTTRATWLRTQVDGMNAGAGNPALAAAARINANAYVMARYAGPLAVFVRGSSLSRLGEPEELVNGFFASRLSDAAWLAALADHSCGPAEAASGARCSPSALQRPSFESPS